LLLVSDSQYVGISRLGGHDLSSALGVAE
jgi:hypothetical protein